MTRRRAHPEAPQQRLPGGARLTPYGAVEKAVGRQRGPLPGRGNPRSARRFVRHGLVRRSSGGDGLTKLIDSYQPTEKITMEPYLFVFF